MDKKVLVGQSIQEGKLLVQKLDKTNLRPRSALWFYQTELDEWKLFLAIKDLETVGPIKMYTDLQKIIKENSAVIHILSLEDIILIETTHPLIGILKSIFSTDQNSIGEIRFTNNVINNFLIEDALIYRIS